MLALADDGSIPDDAVLWRRVHPDFWIFDENTGTDGVTSQAFTDNPGDGVVGMSVRVASMVLAAGLEVESILVGKEAFGVVALTAGLLRRDKQILVQDPKPEGPGHYDVVGDKPKGVKRRWAKGCQWVRKPKGSPRRSTS